MSGDGFVRREVGGLPIYFCSTFLDFPFIRHGFSTRQGGCSFPPSGALNLGSVPWDSPGLVEQNRNRFRDALGIPGLPLATLAQIHSDRVHILEQSRDVWNPDPEGDAMVAGHPGVALAIQVADCFPILMLDPKTRTIAGCHAGWRGTLARIARETVARMRHRFGCDPAEILVAIGPGIRSCCFEAGPEVMEAFRKEFPRRRLDRPRRPGKYLIDLPQAVQVQLSEGGISEANTHDLGACTRCHLDQFFSYRGEGSRAGRMMGLIARME